MHIASPFGILHHTLLYTFYLLFRLYNYLSLIHYGFINTLAEPLMPSDIMAKTSAPAHITHTCTCIF